MQMSGKKPSEEGAVCSDLEFRVYSNDIKLMGGIEVDLRFVVFLNLRLQYCFPMFQTSPKDFCYNNQNMV